MLELLLKIVHVNIIFRQKYMKLYYICISNEVILKIEIFVMRTTRSIIVNIIINVIRHLFEIIFGSKIPKKKSHAPYQFLVHLSSISKCD